LKGLLHKNQLICSNCFRFGDKTHTRRMFLHTIPLFRYRAYRLCVSRCGRSIWSGFPESDTVCSSVPVHLFK